MAAVLVVQREGVELPDWAEAHASPEDRAVGCELQLIELVHLRDHVWSDDERASIDREILVVADELARCA